MSPRGSFKEKAIRVVAGLVYRDHVVCVGLQGLREND